MLNRSVLSRKHQCLNKRILALNVQNKNQGLCSMVSEGQGDPDAVTFFSSAAYCCQTNNSQGRGQMLKRLYVPALVMAACDLECV